MSYDWGELIIYEAYHKRFCLCLCAVYLNPLYKGHLWEAEAPRGRGSSELGSARSPGDRRYRLHPGSYPTL